MGLNASTGVLSGVPAVGSVGSYGGLKVHVVDGMGGEADSATFSIVVHPAPTPLTVSGSPSSAATVGTAYNAAFSASGGSGSGYVYSMIGTLPAGLALNAATGAIFGTPTISSVGSHVGLKVHVVDGAGNQADSAPFSIIVGTPPLPLIVSGTPSGTAVENSAYSAAFVASGGSGSGYVYSIIGTLPAGLALNTSTGVLSGVPSVGSAGSYTGLKIHVVDGAGGQADSALFSIIVSPASLTLAGSPSSSATEGSAYAAAFVASGGSGSGYVYSITGTLPSGLSLNPVSGVLSGTPAVGSAGSYSGLRVHVGDSGGNQADSAIFTIVVAPAPTSPLVVSGAPSGAAIEGVGYLATFVASGGSGSGYVYSVVGTLPSGLQINSATGLLYGVPASGSVGTYANLKVHATDGAGHHADSPTFTLYVTPQGPDDGALRIVGPLSAAMTEGVPGEIQFVASGGSGTGYVFMMYRASELVNDKLPDGLSIDPDTGIISGTPAPGSAGSYRYLQVKVIDSEGNIADSSLFRLTVAAPGSPLTVDGTPYLESRAGYAYPRVAFVAAGGSGSGYTYSMVGTFPPGLTLDPATGVLSGMSAYGSQGTYSNLKVHATDSLGNEAETAAFNIKITAADPLQITGTPGDAMEGKYYRFVPKTIAGTGVGYVFSAIGLPTWASLDPATGALSGTPPVQGFERTHTGIRITVKDSLGNQVTLGPLNVTVLAAGAPMTLSYSGYDLATVGTNYSSTFQASGGSGRGYSYQFVGIPPRGLLLVTSNTEPAYGAFYGIPSTEGVFKIWVRATDSVGNHATSEPFMLKVTSTHNSYPPSPTGVGAITGKVGQNMNVAPFSYVPGGGTPPYRYVFPVNGLPPGLSGDPATGRIYGVPTQVGTFPIGVRLADSEDVLSEHYGSTTLTIQPADPLVFGGVPLTATQNQPYSYSLTELTTGGTAPFNYALTSGVLPDGLSMAANGTVSGVPTGPTTTPTITVTDAFGKTASSTLTFAVASGNSNVFAWGYNGYGQLGDSTLVSKSTRASVLGGKTYTQISAGVSFACGIVTDGTVDCWGANFFGQLGNGTTTASSTPVQVSGLTGVTAISAGSAHVCAISMNSLYCWGYNGNGQLGNGNTTHQRTPIVIFGLSKPTMISAGNAHTCAIVSGGTAYCWGYNGQGQLGTGDTTSRISAGLVQVQAVGTATMISAGNRHSCAVFTGKVACWGGNDLGQIGDGSTIQRNSPVYVAGLTSNITALASAPGAQHTCVVQSGAVKCWGLNASGQAGNGTTTSPQKSPVTAMASGVTKVSVGGNNSCAVQNGALRCWGSNVEGQVGDGTTTQRTSSVAVIGGEGLSSVSVGGDGDQSFVVAK